MALDVFDREVKLSIDDLRKALVGDVGQEKEAAQTQDKNTDQLKKLNDNLEKIVGDDLNRELKSLNKLIKRVAECCEEATNKRGRTIEKEAQAYAKAVAKSLKSSGGGGGDISKSVEKALDKLEPAFEQITDKTMTFGKVLERSQRRFSAAFGMIGKDFEKTFSGLGQAIKDRLKKLNPFKAFEKSGEKSAEDTKNILLKTWSNITATVSNLWSGVTSRVSGWWKSVTDTASNLWSGVTSRVSGWWKSVTDTASNLWSGVASRVSGWWKSVTDTASNLWSGVAKKVSESWLGKTAGFVGRTVDSLGKAAAGAVKDLFKLGKGAEVAAGAKAGRETDDLTGDPTKKTMTGEGTPVRRTRTARVAGGQSDLCRCICRCIGRLTGVTKEGVKHSRQEVQIAKQSKGVGIAQLKAIAGKGRGGKGGGGGLAVGGGDSGDDIRKMMFDEGKRNDKRWQVENRRAIWQQRASNARNKMLAKTQQAANFVFGENQQKAMLENLAQGVAKTGGFIAQAPFALLGGLTELGTVIPYVGGLFGVLGGMLKTFGGALGGLTQGLIAFVLTPLVEQVEYMSDASQAMFVSTGATTMAPTVNMAGLGKPPEGTGEEWTNIAKRVVEFSNGVDSASRTMEKLGHHMDAVAETGVRFNKVQEKTLKNFKRGIRETQTLNKVTRIGLQTGTLLNANAENTADLFADWHQHLGMSTRDLRSMQRGLTQIARSTGLVGDNLIQAAKSAQTFMEHMRLSGTLTTQAARSLTELMARGQMTGTSAAAQSMAKILSQGRLRGNLSTEEQALAAVGGGGDQELQDAITFGIVAGNKELEARFAGNLENWMRTQVGGDPTKSLAENMKKLSARQISMLSTITKNMFGVGAEELRIQIENMKESSKSFGERIKDLDKATSNQAMSLEQIRAVTDKEKGWRDKFETALKAAGGDTSKALEEMLNMADLPKEMRKQFSSQLSAQQKLYQKQQLFLTTGADLLDEFNKSVEDGTSTFDQGIVDLAMGNKDFLQYLNKIGAAGKSGGEALETVLLDQAKKMKEEADKIGAPELAASIPTAKEISDAIAKKDPKLVKSLTEQFATVQGAIQRQAQKKADPMTEIKDILQRIEGAIKQFVLTKIFELLPMVTQALRSLSEAPFWKAFEEGNIRKGFELLGEWIENLMPNIIKAMGQIQGLAQSPEFVKFTSAIIEAVATIARPMMEAIGKWIKDNAPDLANMFEGFDINDFIKKIKDIGETIKKVIDFLWEWKEVILVVLGVLTVGAIAGGLIGAFTSLGVSLAGLGPILAGLGPVIGGLVAAAAPVALVATAAVATVAVKEHIETVNKENRVQAAASDKLWANMQAEFTADTDRRLAVIESMNKQQLDATIMERQKIANEYKEGWDRLPKFYSIADDIAGRTKVWKADAKNFEGAYNQEMNTINELRSKKFRLAIKAMAPEEASEAYKKVQGGETAHIKGFGQMAQGDIPGGTALLKERLAEINKGRQEALGKEITGIVGRTLTPATIAKGGGAEKVNKTIQDYIKGHQFIGKSDKELTTEQKAQRISAENAEKTLKELGVDTVDMAKIISMSFKDLTNTAEMGDKEIVSRLEKIAALLDPKNTNRAKSIRDAEKGDLLNNLTDWTKSYTNSPQFINSQARKSYFEVAGAGRTATETVDQALLRKYYGLSQKQQDKLGIKDFDQLNKDLYAPIAKKLFAGGANQDTMKYIEDNAKNLNADVVAEIFKSHGAELPKAISEKLQGAGTGKATADTMVGLTGGTNIAPAAAMTPAVTPEKILSVLEQILVASNKTADATQKLTGEATKTGTLYVEDASLKETVDKNISPAVNKNIAVSPLMPGVSKDVEEELRRRKAESQNGESVDMAKTESNTGSTASNTRAMVRLLGQIGRMLAKRKSGNLGVEGPDYPLDAFFNENLGVEWPNARVGRSVGLEFEHTDIS